MSRIIQENRWRAARGIVAALALSTLLGACAQIEIAPHLRPLSGDAMMLLGKKGMNLQAPIFVRVFKEESELEVWKQRDDDRYYLYKVYPICNWSGSLGPKLRSGDRQAPEGFYTVSRDQMRPDSKHYLAFNLGFPNAYDKSNRRTGHALMVHGKCSSAGCYAMTDALMEEIYALAREAIIGGQDNFHVHAFPFRMTQANMARHSKSEWFAFWRTLKEGYDYFELTRQVPTIAVCNRRYVVNVSLPMQTVRMSPEGACPAFHRPTPSPFVPRPGEQYAETPVVAPGQKMRTTSVGLTPDFERSGLTKAPGSGSWWWERALAKIGGTLSVK
ncbi:MAG TPA: murein L,D-transpeptidase family protein [Hyphomicrobiaceae bacterium]|jgi:murein L,D-transpeptidase YafK|nr:murein L,D-transpeptidase family protein [Hyphomicrobiaceae bacterium]